VHATITAATTIATATTAHGGFGATTTSAKRQTNTNATSAASASAPPRNPIAPLPLDSSMCLIPAEPTEIIVPPITTTNVDNTGADAGAAAGAADNAADDAAALIAAEVPALVPGGGKKNKKKKGKGAGGGGVVSSPPAPSPSLSPPPDIAPPRPSGPQSHGEKKVLAAMLSEPVCAPVDTSSSWAKDDEERDTRSSWLAHAELQTHREKGVSVWSSPQVRTCIVMSCGVAFHLHLVSFM
jgi:hypothetical protein